MVKDNFSNSQLEMLYECFCDGVDENLLNKIADKNNSIVKMYVMKNNKTFDVNKNENLELFFLELKNHHDINFSREVEEVFKEEIFEKTYLFNGQCIDFSIIKSIFALAQNINRKNLNKLKDIISEEDVSEEEKVEILDVYLHQMGVTL